MKEYELSVGGRLKEQLRSLTNFTRTTLENREYLLRGESKVFESPTRSAVSCTQALSLKTGPAEVKV